MPPSTRKSRAKNGIIGNIAARQSVRSELAKLSEARCKTILSGANPVQRDFILDTSPYVAGRCPRRSGKTFAVSSLALYTGELQAGSRTLIVSLTLKSTKENYWTRSPGGIFAQNSLYSLGLEFNRSDYVWTHHNGSTGMLAGAETRADIEKLRGASAEADLIIVDECKSFAPQLLTELVRDVLEPGLITRQGRLVMIGTPGNIPSGPFYEATEPNFVDPETQRVGCKQWAGAALTREDGMFSLHTWTLEDNVAVRGQWDNALAIKNKYKWTDETPVWRREYLGEWVTDTRELVYAYAVNRSIPGKVTWIPQVSKKNITGLPEELGPWNLIMGLDFGYEDQNAIVLAAYSETAKELRHVEDFKQSHMTIDEFGRVIKATIDRYGMPNVIVGDKGSLGGVLYLQELNSRFGLGIIEAEKREKYDHIELLNSDFYSGRIKIIPGSDLDTELCALQWDLSKHDKERLIRTGKLREDPSCSNHLCDALLYLWRYCYHYWSEPISDTIDKKSPAYIAQAERESIERLKAKIADDLEKSSKWENDPWRW